MIKLDFAKAFDSVNWASLLKILEVRDFPSKWCDWMRQLLVTSKFVVLLNRVLGHG